MATLKTLRIATLSGCACTVIAVDDVWCDRYIRLSRHVTWRMLQLAGLDYLFLQVSPQAINRCVCFIQCRSTKLDIVLCKRGCFCSAAYPTYFVFRPLPDPMGVGYEGFNWKAFPWNSSEQGLTGFLLLNKLFILTTDFQTSTM